MDIKYQRNGSIKGNSREYNEKINNFKTNTTIINTNFAPNNNINKVFLSQNPTQRG